MGVFTTRKVYRNAISLTAGGDTAQATAFVARLDGSQNATHTTAYKTLINGLVNDSSGIWICLDGLYIFATNNTANSLLNLVSTSFNATVSLGTPTFTADQGYTGNAGIDVVTSNFNPSSSGGLYSANSAHISVWNNTNSTSATALVNCIGGGASSSIFCFAGDTKIYARINDPTGTPSDGNIPAGPEYRGLIIGTRTGASTQKIYKYNNSGLEDLSNNNTTSAGLPTANIDLTQNPTNQQMAVSIGSQLSSAQATALGAWLRGYLVTISGISY